MLGHAGPLAVIQAGTAQATVIEFEPQRSYQVQATAGIRTKAYDIAGVRRNLRLVKHHMKHHPTPGKA